MKIAFRIIKDIISICFALVFLAKAIAIYYFNGPFDDRTVATLAYFSAFTIAVDVLSTWRYHIVDEKVVKTELD